jgi:hypothetical protein
MMKLGIWQDDYLCGCVLRTASSGVWLHGLGFTGRVAFAPAK